MESLVFGTCRVSTSGRWRVVIGATCAVFVLIVAGIAVDSIGGEVGAPERSETPETARATSVGEAEYRAQLLHEVIRGALQIMHRDFFDDENAHAIPSASLEDVFESVERQYGVSIRWLVVNTDVLNVDHRAEDEFERMAAKRLGRGETRVASVERRAGSRESEYRYVGAIRLGSQCLKCHVKRRTSNEDRVAGLALTIPLRPADTQSTRQNQNNRP